MGSFWTFQLVGFIRSLPRLFDLWRFYTYLLGVPDVSYSTETPS